MQSSNINSIKWLLLSALFMFSGCQSLKTQQSTSATLNGVNFGGMYVLEDWFFSPESVGHHVSTPCNVKNTGIASSNIFSQNTQAEDFTWTSETNLIQQFLNKGYSETQITEIFQRHRDTYLFQEMDGPKNLSDTFKQLNDLGIKLVRLPITWAITYPNHDYTLKPGNGGTAVTVPATDKVVLISDPFNPEQKWASIPITQIETLLQVAGKHGVKILLEVHAYPGGSGDGTFNGVWPNPPKFWTTGLSAGRHPIYQENFQTIFQNIIYWAEGLFFREDKSYSEGLAGLSPMNEPAHLMGIAAARCDQETSWGVESEQQILATLALAIKEFQNSTLPYRNVKLYMNVIETMIEAKDPLKVIGTWWKKVAEEKARKQWAVLDVHHYIAWDAEYNNCLDRHIEEIAGNRSSINAEGFSQVEKSSEWFLSLRRNLGLSQHDLLSTSEFSASTHSDTWHSCASGRAKDEQGNTLELSNSKEYRNAFIEAQLKAANSENITTIFWTWMLPYNPNYKNEWSLFSICRGDKPPQFCSSNH